MANFHKSEIKIAGTKILAQNATISENVSISPASAMGYKTPLDNALRGNITNTINIDYYVETNAEPSYVIVTGLINSTGRIFTPTQLVIGGITGSGYLDSYSLQIAPNELVKSSVSFFSFDEFTGNFTDQPISSTSDNSLSSSGVAHYWTTQVTNDANTSTGNVLQFNYGFKADWNSIFRIGYKKPSFVIYNNSQETYNLLMETPNHITFNPKSTQSSFTFNVLKISNISTLWTSANANTLTFYLNSGNITKNEMGIQENNLSTISLEAVKYN